MPVHQQDLDQQPSSLRFAAFGAGECAEGLVDLGEDALGAGLRERRRAAQRAGLGQQDLQEVVQVVVPVSALGQPRVAGHHLAAVVDPASPARQPTRSPTKPRPWGTGESDTTGPGSTEQRGVTTRLGPFGVCGHRRFRRYNLAK